jgi:small subunit ribosomal protein S17
MQEETENQQPEEEQPAAQADEQAPEEQAPEEQAAEEAPAPAAEEPAEAEPEEKLSPKAARKRARSQASGPAGPQRSSEERARERTEARARKAAERSRWRAKRRQKLRERSAGAAAPQEAAPSEPGKRKVRQGVVVSSKGDKTITVRIDAVRRHRVYGKVIRETSTLHAHDETNQAGEGDTVRVMECRPLSRTKRWRLVDVLEKAR